MRPNRHPKRQERGDLHRSYGKLVKGHKRLVVLDPPGNVLANRVPPAHMSDAAAAIAFRGEVAARQPLLAQVQVVLGNSSFAGQFAEHLGRC